MGRCSANKYVPVDSDERKGREEEAGGAGEEGAQKACGAKAHPLKIKQLIFQPKISPAK